MNIHKKDRLEGRENLVVVASRPENLTEKLLNKNEIDFIAKKHRNDQLESFMFNRLDRWIFVYLLKEEKEIHKNLEACRKLGDKLQQEINSRKESSVAVTGAGATPEQLLALAEGAALGNYQFLKYFKDKHKKQNSLRQFKIVDEDIAQLDVDRLNIQVQAVAFARDLVNEPVMYMNAPRLAEMLYSEGTGAGLKVEVLNRKKIESLKMGGLLAVNKGSVDPPTFTIMEWKPSNAINDKPLVFVGKGVVYDTGGMNIKTGSYMEDMKMDMAGAAVMGSVMIALARAKVPVYAVGLIPATDNRLSGNAYVSGDVITMYNGMTVEVINTDAEGRMILADALSYAQKYKPGLVIDAATLTGSAQRAIGKHGLVAMQAGAETEMQKLKRVGYITCERVAELPFWEEYADMMKSEIADIKNAGPAEAGAITAGKFLEKFTDYPFIHLDIAGVAFNKKRESYRNQGGSGFGVRLLFNFVEEYIGSVTPV